MGNFQIAITFCSRLRIKHGNMHCKGRQNMISQVHPMLGGIGGLGRMNYEEKLTKSSLLHLMVSKRRMKM
jgi:hypothetical protein